MKSDAFKAAAEAKDFSAIDELFSEHPTFRSPAVFKPYEGIEAIGAVLGAVSQVFEEFRYSDQIETGNTAMLMFEAKIGNRELNGVDILRFDEDGRVHELIVMVRPLSGLNALVEAMAEQLAAMGVPAPGAAS